MNIADKIAVNAIIVVVLLVGTVLSSANSGATSLITLMFGAAAIAAFFNALRIYAPVREENRLIERSTHIRLNQERACR